MRNSRLSWISLVISIVALVVSIIVLVNYCPTQGLSFDYMGVIVGILSLLVTALIGAQVGQYVFVDKKIEKIASTITRTIARKAAQDEARRVAQDEAKKVAQSIAETISTEASKSTAMAVVGGLPDDVKDMMRGKDLIRDAREQGMMSEMMKGIDLVMQALVEFKRCKYEVLYKSAIDDALEDLIMFFEECQDNGGLRILKGKRHEYEEILKDIRSEKRSQCIDYLNKSEEKEIGFDEELSNKAVEDIFNNAVNKAEGDVK